MTGPPIDQTNNIIRDIVNRYKAMLDEQHDDATAMWLIDQLADLEAEDDS